MVWLVGIQLQGEKEIIISSFIKTGQKFIPRISMVHTAQMDEFLLILESLLTKVVRIQLRFMQREMKTIIVIVR